MYCKTIAKEGVISVVFDLHVAVGILRVVTIRGDRGEVTMDVNRGGVFAIYGEAVCLSSFGVISVHVATITIGSEDTNVQTIGIYAYYPVRVIAVVILVRRVMGILYQVMDSVAICNVGNFV